MPADHARGQRTWARARRLHADAALVVLNTVVLLILVETCSAVVHRVLLSTAPPESAYRDPEGWNYRDVKVPPTGDYFPYVVWKMKPVETRYVHVDSAGLRATPGARCVPGSYTVFLFGGSTMWGTGVPDGRTIPAYVQARLGSLRGEPVCVRNLGQPGWVSTQSVIELLRRLQAGDVPDLVVFYDGLNDTHVAAAEGMAGVHELVGLVRHRLNRDHAARRGVLHLVAVSRTFQLLERAAPSLAELRSWPGRYRLPPDQDIGEAVVRAYLANYRLVEAAAGELGFGFAFFWQPHMFHGPKPMTPPEAALARRAREKASPRAVAVGRLTYPAIRAASRDRDRLFYLGDVFRDVGERVYIDEYHHLTPRGNEIVAERILADLVAAGILQPSR